MQQSTPLIEVHGFGDVRRNGLIILAQLRDAVHLNSEQHRNSFSSESSRQSDGFRSTPTVPVDGDAGVELFPSRQLSIVVNVQQPQNLPARLLALTIQKHSHLHAGWVILPQTALQLDLGMYRIITPNHPANESDNDGCRGQDVAFDPGALPTGSGTVRAEKSENERCGAEAAQRRILHDVLGVSCRTARTPRSC